MLFPENFLISGKNFIYPEKILVYPEKMFEYLGKKVLNPENFFGMSGKNF